MSTSRGLRRRWPLVVGLALAAALVFVAPVSAGEILDDETLVIGADEVVEDDLTWAGESLTVDGTIQGDLVAAGREIVVNGTVEGDVLLAGMSVVVNGEVQDDAYIGGYLVNLGEGAALSDELRTGAFSLEADGGSLVGGDLLFGAYQALLGGQIDGDVLGGGQSVQLDGAIGGDAELGVGEPGQEANTAWTRTNPNLPPVAVIPTGLTVGEDASIGGAMKVTSTVEPDVPSGVVAGAYEFVREVAEAEPEFEFKPTRPGEALGFVAGQFVLRMVRRFITLVLVGLLIVWLGSKLLTDTVQTFESKPWTSLGVGALGYVVFFGVVFVLPGLLILLGLLLGIISLGGLVPGLVAFGALGWSGLIVAFFTATSWLAKIVLGFWLGQLIWKAVNAEGTSLVPALLIGAALAAVLTAIPVAGNFLLNLLIALFGLGAIILTLRERMRPAGAPARAV